MMVLSYDVINELVFKFDDMCC